MKIYALILMLISHYALSCPVGYQQFRDSCYTFNKELVTWQDAWQYCEIFGSYLVEINDGEENDFIVSGMRGHGLNVAWTCGSERIQRGTWIWTASGQPFEDFTDWSDVEPSGIEEDCLAVDSGLGYRWNDLSCTLSYQFICERKNVQPTEDQ